MASLNDRHKLVWRQPTTQQVHPLPSNITREFIPTLLGDLEILCSNPPDTIAQHRRVLFFQHGGFGHAAVWLPFLTYFAKRGYRCYALSLRGHGASWDPGFWGLVWWTGKGDMRDDLAKGVEWVKKKEAREREDGFGEEDLILVGHSAGGGMVQDYLGRGGRVGGLVLVAAIPFSGG